MLRSFVLACLVLFSGSGVADTCANISGTYAESETSAFRTRFEQRGCATLTGTWLRRDGGEYLPARESVTYPLDGFFHASQSLAGLPWQIRWDASPLGLLETRRDVEPGDGLMFYYTVGHDGSLTIERLVGGVVASSSRLVRVAD